LAPAGGTTASRIGRGIMAQEVKRGEAEGPHAGPPPPRSDSKAMAAVQAVRRARALESATLGLSHAFAEHDVTNDAAAALGARDRLALHEATSQWQQGLLGPEAKAIGLQLSQAFSAASEALASATATATEARADTRGSDGEAASPTPELERLERELRQAAADCQADPSACRDAISGAERTLGSLAAEEAQAQEEQLQQSAGLQAAAPAKGERGLADRAGQQRAPEAPSLANGDEGSLSSRGHSDSKPTGHPGESHNSDNVPNAEAEATTIIQAPSAHSTSAPPSVGLPPTPAAPTKAQDFAVELAQTPPDGAELVASTAVSGFGAPAYRAAFTAYRTALEDTLERASVPATRRHIVRRYFHRIRPVISAEKQ
jgi:hypothetical protein